jgi:hypothetical protein
MHDHGHAHMFTLLCSTTSRQHHRLHTCIFLLQGPFTTERYLADMATVYKQQILMATTAHHTLIVYHLRVSRRQTYAWLIVCLAGRYEPEAKDRQRNGKGKGGGGGHIH